MSDNRKIVCLNPAKLTPETLLAQLAELADLEALVAVYRIGGRWQTAWTSKVPLGSLSMAAMKLSADTMQELHRGDGPRADFTPPEDAA